MIQYLVNIKCKSLTKSFIPSTCSSNLQWTKQQSTDQERSVFWSFFKDQKVFKRCQDWVLQVHDNKRGERLCWVLGDGRVVTNQRLGGDLSQKAAHPPWNHSREQTKEILRHQVTRDKAPPMDVCQQSLTYLICIWCSINLTKIWG